MAISRKRPNWLLKNSCTRSEEHTSELQSQSNLVCRLLLEKKKTNVVVILADDFGYVDPSCRGGAVPTPNLDRLFRDGMELETLLVYPVCSPTRCAMLTGRH